MCMVLVEEAGVLSTKIGLVTLATGLFSCLLSSHTFTYAVKILVKCQIIAKIVNVLVYVLYEFVIDISSVLHFAILDC